MSGHATTQLRAAWPVHVRRRIGHGPSRHLQHLGLVGLTLRASYTQETDLSYYGLGNAAAVDGGSNDPYYNFDWTHPKVEANAELHLAFAFELVLGASFTRNEIRAPQEGKLRLDSRSESAELRHLTRFVPEFDVLTLSSGLNWDTRDDEVSPERGHYHSLRFDFAPSLHR